MVNIIVIDASAIFHTVKLILIGLLLFEIAMGLLLRNVLGKLCWFLVGDTITDWITSMEKTGKTHCIDIKFMKVQSKNCMGLGSNADRLYQHIDLKLLKNGGGSHTIKKHNKISFSFSDGVVV